MMLNRVSVATTKRGLVLNEVTEIFQFDGQVDVVHHDILRDLKNYRGEIQDARDTSGHEAVCHFLSNDGRNSQDRHLHAIGDGELTELFHRVDGLLDLLVPFPFCIDIERGHDLETFLLEPAIREQGETHVADAYENYGLQAVGAEQIRDHLGQLLNIITQAARAELAEVS